jgi:glycine cleavage system H protein
VTNLGSKSLKITTENKIYHFPLDRYYYTQEPGHIWLKPEGELLLVGFDDFGQSQGPILHIRTRPIGKIYSQGKAFGTVETNKFIGQLRFPVSGSIVETNSDIFNDPQLINNAPYDQWIVKIKPTNLDEDLKSDYIIPLGNKDFLEKYMVSELIKYEDPPI